MKRIWIVMLLLMIVGVVFVSASAYVVDETEQIIVTEFGEPIGEPITEAGLHWKTPFVQTVNRFDKRILAFDGASEQIPTKDKKYIFIETFARWRIADPLKFFKAVRDEKGAQARLDDIIDAATRDAISANTLQEAVRNSNRELTVDEVEADESLLPGAIPKPVGDQGVDTQPPVTIGREQITAQILANSTEKIAQYGIELIGIRIKRINYVEEVRKRVYERMISERAQIAEKYRSEGEQFRLGFTGKIGREKDKLLSEAYATAEQTKAEGDAEAARIYAEAYSKDPEFYRFWRTLQFYGGNLGANSTLVLGTDSDLFRYLADAKLQIEDEPAK